MGNSKSLDRESRRQRYLLAGKLFVAASLFGLLGSYLFGHGLAIAIAMLSLGLSTLLMASRTADDRGHPIRWLIWGLQGIALVFIVQSFLGRG